MVRSFSSEALRPAALDGILGAALRSPTAGNTGGTAWIVLEGATETATYWNATTDEAWRARNPDRFAGLRRAPVVLLSYGCPDAYAERYGEPDKDDAGLAGGDWPVPYWFGDAAFGVMAVLLAAVDAGLGACFLGNFRGETALALGLQVPNRWHLFGAVLLGRPDGHDRRSRSLDRAAPPPAQRIHRGRW
jgi:nitroreductase